MNIMISHIAIFRRLIAKYWQPLTLLGSAVTAILNLLKLAQNAGLDIKLPVAGRLVGTTQGDIILRVVIFVGVFILIRFPRITIFITKIILGRPEAPANLPRLFRGPRSYDEEDFGKLPGRKKEIDDCLIDIRNKSFFILEGESGCGKSSLLKAALIPALAKKFTVIKCQVADDPFGKLLAALQNKSYNQVAKTADEKAILDFVAKAGSDTQNQPKHTKPLLVSIDQFEELFVTVADKVRAKFFQMLKDAIMSGGIRLVIVIRSDFRDLLDKACREIDPQQAVLDLSSYYILSSFERKQAQYIVNEILKPYYQDDPMLQQESKNFADSLADELLRPPRDMRLNQNDEKTVLPIELQIIGFMLESAGVQNFSVKNLRKLGGKIGLLREYIESAKNFVWHKTGVPGKDSLRILHHLISPSQTKWAQSPRAISKAMNYPEVQVEGVLQSFAEKYLINILPVARRKDGTADEQEGFAYELMHEHLIRILTEAPDPVLQKVRDAKERLQFWVDRNLSLFTKTDKMSLLAKFTRFFQMPIPLFESIKLWRFADQRDERHLLKINLRSFAARILLLLLPLGGWILWTYTDSYQVRSIIADAPLTEMIAGGSDDSYETIEDYLKIVIKLGQTEQILAIVRDAGDIHDHSWALRYIATELVKSGHTDQALAVALDISLDYERSDALREIATELAKLGETEKARDIAHNFSNAYELSPTLRIIATELAKIGQTKQARDIAHNISDAHDRSRALRNIATELAKTGQTKQALDIAHNISDAKCRFYALSNISTELAKAGQAKQARDTANKISDAFIRSCALRSIAAELAKAGQLENAKSIFDEALSVAHNISDTANRSTALCDIATELAKAGQIKLALSTAHDVGEEYIFRSLALINIATELVKAGHTEQALTAASYINNAEYRSEALCKIATQLAKEGLIDDANHAFAEALMISHDIIYGKDQYRALINITTEMTKYGQTEQALTATRNIRDALTRSQVLSNIATQLAKASLIEDANRTYAEALAVAHAIEFGDDRYSSLINITTEMAKSGQTERALTAARNIRDAFSRSQALSNIAREFVRINETEVAVESLEEALSTSREFDNIERRSAMLTHIAKGFAQLYYYRKARHVANECDYSEDKLEAYTVILEVFYDKKHPVPNEEEPAPQDSTQVTTKNLNNN